MKKLLIMIGVIAASMQVTTARAQAYMGTGVAEDDKMIFNHLSAGVNLGTDGWGLEVAAPITPYVAVRTGFSSIPKIGFTVKNIDVHKNSSAKAGESGSSTENISLDFKLKMTNWKLLFDIYPSKNSSFHFTLGAFVGGDEFVTAEYDGGRPADGNWATYPTDHRNQGIKVGEDWFGITGENWTKAAIKVNNFKPYVGIGFGRAVKQAPGLAFNFDMGVQFWGKPKVYGMVQHLDNLGFVDGYEFREADINGYQGDGKDATEEAAKWLSKLTVWPTLSFRLTYTIF